MSIDDRLRGSLRDQADAFGPRVEDALDRVHARGRHARWRRAALAVGSAAAVATIAGAAYMLDGPSRGEMHPAERQAATTGEDCPNPNGGDCLGPLKLGRYETTEFEPTVAYSVPNDTWANLQDLTGNFLLLRPQDPQQGAVSGSYLGVYQNVRAPALDCAEAPQPGVGNDPEKMVEFYQGIHGLQVSQPIEVTVGGLHGYQLDFAVKRNNALCTYDGHPATPLITGNGVSDLHHVVAPQVDVRLILLSWKRGNVTIEITNVKKQYSAAAWRQIVRPIVNSFQFG